MNEQAIIEAIDGQHWTDTVGDSVASAVDSAFKAGGESCSAIEDFLHGKWLGHALHPALTDVPLGAWTVAATLDCIEMTTGRQDLAPGADAAVAIGLVGAVGAAATGVTDWKDTSGRARRIGLVHGLLNITATSLFAASWFLRRKKDQRTLAQWLGFTGYAVGSASAWLGGHLIHNEGVSVERTRRATAGPPALEADRAQAEPIVGRARKPVEARAPSEAAA